VKIHHLDAATWLANGSLPEAIVAANDEMAIGAVQHLHSVGVRVPDDVAVVGFDDTEVTGSMIPSLTSVRQPLADVGRRAAELVWAKLSGEPVPDEVVLRSSAVVRESCGCSARAVLQVPERTAELSPGLSLREAMLEGVAEVSDLPKDALGDWPTALGARAHLARRRP